MDLYLPLQFSVLMTESIQASSSGIAHAHAWSFMRAPRGDSPHGSESQHSELQGSEPQGVVMSPVEHEMVHARLGILSSLYVSLRAKHGPAASHSFRVAAWASLWGVSFNLGEKDLQLLETVGLLHEIGKIGIPDRVLQKPERLTEIEQSMMSMHRQVGIEILKAAGGSHDLLNAIGGVGALFDNSVSAKPRDLPSIASRLINIIDAYDSMVTEQVYRKPLTSEMALAEIFKNCGSQFDPHLVRSFAEVLLQPKPEVLKKVEKRWLSKIGTNEQRRLFQFDDPDIDRVNSASELGGSALVQTLNGSFYRHMMDNVQDGVIFIDSEFRVLDWNSAATRMTGVTAESIFHCYWTPACASLCDAYGFALDESQCPFRELLATGDVVSRQLTIRPEGKDLINVSLEAIPVYNDMGQFCGGAIILEDISETALLEQKIISLRERACVDQLTKVPNRGELNRQLPEFVKYHQVNNQPGCIIICDIDFFKKINDNFSHQVGDEALIVFAGVLKDSCRSSDFVARYGGEEFVMLCSRCDLSEAKEWAEMIRTKLQRTPIAAIGNACITASFGVSIVLPSDSAETVLDRADKGLLIAKENGRDRVVALGGDTVKFLSENKSSTSRSWFRWGAPQKDIVQNYQLITNVPKVVTLEKLKGFVAEVTAVVLDVSVDQVRLEVDCIKLVSAMSKHDRPAKFRMEIKVVEVEMDVALKGRNRICSLVEVKINPTRNRDRRSESVLFQADRLKVLLQGVLVAQEVDLATENAILRRFKPEKDSRY